MPTHIRAQIQWSVGTMLPRDVMQITPCFRHNSWIPGVDDPGYQTLADDLATAISTVTASDKQIQVKLYDISLDAHKGDGREPNRPKATKVLNAGACAESTQPRELAVCLSFYGGKNSPRQRGRLYLPVGVTTAAGSLGVRVPSGIRTTVGSFASKFASLGGPNVDWIVWSPTNESATKVTNWFVDDEWDVVRKRGYSPSARTTGTTDG